jgi:hypothetical protein
MRANMIFFEGLHQYAAVMILMMRAMIAMIHDDTTIEYLLIA